MGLLDAFGARHLTADTTVWRPGAVNTFTVAAADVTRDGPRVWIRLHESRWGGCAVGVWADWVSTADGVVTVRIPVGTRQGCRLTDGRHHQWITAAELWHDRRHPRSEVGPAWEVPAVWHPGEHNAIIVAVEDVTANPSGKSRRITLRCSRWEGLYFSVPNHRVRSVGAHEQRIVLVRDEPHITLYGGAKPVVVSAHDLFDDHVNPLPEPGPVLAVEHTEWLTLPVWPCHLRRATTKFGVRHVLRFPRYAQRWPRAQVWLPTGFVKADEDGPRLCLPAEHLVRVRTLDDGVVEVAAGQFVELVRVWAQTAPAPTRGVQTLDPDPVAPVSEVVIPDDLLDD